MGKELGKGGFAICYEGTLVGQKRGTKAGKFALKIVKAKMALKKMEEKVGVILLSLKNIVLTLTRSSKQSYKSILKCGILTSSSSTGLSHSRRIHTLS